MNKETYKAYLRQRLLEMHSETHDIEGMASHVHNEWRRRNPKEDYNAAQHVDYSELPEHEKEKDRQHIRLALQLRQDNPREDGTSLKEHEEYLAQKFGSIQHEAWRSGHETAKGVGAPRIKKVSDGPDVNINVPWSRLHPEWKQENLEAGRAAIGITGILQPTAQSSIAQHPEHVPALMQHMGNDLSPVAQSSITHHRF